MVGKWWAVHAERYGSRALPTRSTPLEKCDLPITAPGSESPIFDPGVRRHQWYVLCNRSTLIQGQSGYFRGDYHWCKLEYTHEPPCICWCNRKLDQ